VDSGCASRDGYVGATVDEQLYLRVESGDQLACERGERAGVQVPGTELHKIYIGGGPASGELQKLGVIGVIAGLARNGIADHVDKCSCDVLRNGERGYDGGDTQL